MAKLSITLGKVFPLVRSMFTTRHIDNYALNQPDKNRMLAASLVEASGKYPRFGYRRIAFHVMLLLRSL